MNEFLRLLDKAKIVMGLAPRTPSSDEPDYVSLKGYGKATVLILVDNGDTVTGSDIALKQATAVDGSDEKTLGFDTVFANEDTADSDELVETTVSSDTFTTDDTNGKNLVYAIEIDAADLDQDNDFDCIRADTGNGTNMVLAVAYILHAPRYAPTLDVSAVTD